MRNGLKGERKLSNTEHIILIPLLSAAFVALEVPVRGNWTS